MRKPAAWMLGAFAAVLLRRRRRTAAAEPVSQPDPRAEDLRRKLAESRAIVAERDEFESAETAVDQVEAPTDPESRRRVVHDEGRAVAEQMRERS
jgi:hypothetical protein